MKIYVCHATTFDYKNNLYAPLKSSEMYKNNSFYLPHDTQEKPTSSKEIIAKCDLIIAEVSYPSIGLGIELGWADSMNKKIICIHQNDSKPSPSLKIVSSDFIQYSNKEEMINALMLII